MSQAAAIAQIEPRHPPASQSAGSYRTFAVDPLTPTVGAEISGLDLTRPVSAAVADELNRALAEFGAIFIRNQDLTPEQHIAFAGIFGPINVNRFFKAAESYPQIAEVRKEAHQNANIGGSWHTDHSYDEQPARASVLYAREVPPVGGDTLFASMIAAYDALSPGLQRTLLGLRAQHSSRHVFGISNRRLHESDLKDRIGNPDLATQDAVHPVIVTHPETGRRALYVNPNFTVRIEGWNDEESQALLSYLYRHAQRPEFQARFRWQPGSLAVWDNRSTWHLALNDYAGHRRLLHRITIDGPALS